MRVVVVGGGVIGLSTAVELTRAGARVDLVDRGAIPAPSATSHARQRVVRALHRDDPGLTRAAARARDAWSALEMRLGVRFSHRIGALTALPAGKLPGHLAALAGAGVAGHGLSPAELAHRYPVLRLPAGLSAILEPGAMVIEADTALRAMAGWLRGQPTVRLIPHARAVALAEDGTVRLADGTGLRGDRVVLAAGPWSRRLVPAALRPRLTLYRQSMLAYADDPGRWAGVPVVPVTGTRQGAWLIPPVAGAPARLSAASACRAVPDLTDRATPAAWRAHLVEVFRSLLATFDPAAVASASDGYYLAHEPSGGPLLTSYGLVWAYPACGGMSIKLAPLVAAALADRVLDRPVTPTGLSFLDDPEPLVPELARERREHR